jgi:hypothetical protein
VFRQKGKIFRRPPRERDALDAENRSIPESKSVLPVVCWQGRPGGAKETAHMGLPINGRRRAVALELLARSLARWLAAQLSATRDKRIIRRRRSASRLSATMSGRRGAA